MTDPKVIPLQPDQAETEIEGGPAPLTPAGGLEIENMPGNPDATVNLPHFMDKDGVEEGDKLEDQFKPTTNQGENHD